MNKQIEEMSREMCHLSAECETCQICDEKYHGDGDPCYFQCVAKEIINHGYRKASDVAREIDDIRRYIILNENIAKKCKEENGEQNEEYWKGKLAAFLQIRGYIDTELKKKYESEGADDESEL